LARFRDRPFNTLEALPGCDLLNKFAGGEIAFEEQQNIPARDDHFVQSFTVSADNSPTQKTPNTAPQEGHKASAGPGLPNCGTLTATLPTVCLQEGQFVSRVSPMDANSFES